MWRVLFPVLLLLWGLACASGHAQTSPWPQEGSELQADPGVLWEQLGNGMKLALKPHATPNGRLSLRLQVRVGSLQERDNELGAAHFVEHLAFTGTRHHPKGELVKYFERHGMAWGNEANANTFPGHTVYKMDLAANDPASLREALQILRDFCDGIRFDATALDEERGVVLAEERFRNDALQRRNRSLLAATYGSSRLVSRPPIGTRESISRLGRDALRAFHETWYRPERVTLVAVGDFNPRVLYSEINDVFSGFQAARPARTELPVGAPAAGSTPDLCVFSDSEHTGVSLLFRSVRPRGDAPMSLGQYQDHMLAALSNFLIARRIDELCGLPSANFGNGASEIDGLDSGLFEYSELSVGTSADHWKQALAEMESLRRGTCANGFSAEEIARGVSVFTRFFEERVRSAQSRTCSELADDLASTLACNRVFLSPEQEYRHWLDLKDKVSSAECQRVLEAAWSGGHQVLFLGANAQFGLTKDALAIAFAEARLVAPEQPRDNSGGDFPYADFGPAGSVLRRDQLSDLNIVDMGFENGVRFLCRPNAFSKGKVQFSVVFGDGTRGEPPQSPGLRYLVSSWLYGGLRGMPYDKVSRLLYSHLGGVEVSAKDDYFQFYVDCPSSELPFFLRLACAYFSDPSFGQEGFVLARENVDRLYRETWSDFSGMIGEYVKPVLASGDQRFGQVNHQAVARLGLAELKAWLAPQVASAPLTISVVGDVDPEQLMGLVASTFGALSPRKSRTDVAVGPGLSYPEAPTGANYNWTGRSSPSRLLLVYWPLRRPVALRTELELALLMEVTTGRLREQLRDRMGKTYVQEAWLDLHRAYDDFGYLCCLAESGPEEETRFFKAIDLLIEKLGGGPITEDELDRARHVLLNSEHLLRQGNPFWIHALGTYSRHPEYRERLDRHDALLASVRCQDLEAQARLYFAATKPSVFHLRPAPPAATTAAR